MRAVAMVVLLGLVALGCSTEGEAGPVKVTRTPSVASPAPTPSEPPASSAEPAPRVRPADFDTAVALRAVRHLAGTIGPRHATSPSFERAATWVGAQLREAGYDVRRQRFDVPGGNSWGVPVGPGTSLNVVAQPVGFDATRPHLVVGAHLDTVPQAPGAEDNASGIGALLAVAEAVATRRTRLPVVLVAFGAEEPRGPTDADHHYGSRWYVGTLDRRQRQAVRGMLSLDRVGVGTVLPVGSATDGGDRARQQVLAAAERAAVPTVAEFNRSSDHWSFVRAGLPGVRIGSTPYAAYHSAADVPAVVDRRQLERTGRLVLAWLA